MVDFFYDFILANGDNSQPKSSIKWVQDSANIDSLVQHQNNKLNLIALKKKELLETTNLEIDLLRNINHLQNETVVLGSDLSAELIDENFSLPMRYYFIAQKLDEFEYFFVASDTVFDLLTYINAKKNFLNDQLKLIKYLKTNEHDCNNIVERILAYSINQMFDPNVQDVLPLTASIRSLAIDIEQIYPTTSSHEKELKVSAYIKMISSSFDMKPIYFICDFIKSYFLHDYIDLSMDDVFINDAIKYRDEMNAGLK